MIHRVLALGLIIVDCTPYVFFSFFSLIFGEPEVTRSNLCCKIPIYYSVDIPTFLQSDCNKLPFTFVPRFVETSMDSSMT